MSWIHAGVKSGMVFEDRMDHPVSKRRNLRTGLLLALVAVAVFVYTIWAVMHHKL
jgi:hypothetical protein